MKHETSPRLRLLAISAASVALVSCATSTFDATDTNHDGRISTTEIRSILTKSVFDASDADGDGKVTLAEWKAANPKDDVSLFTERDLNGDGVVTQKEFTKHVAEDGTFDGVIAELDPGDDGTVSVADFDAFTKEHQIGS